MNRIKRISCLVTILLSISAFAQQSAKVTANVNLRPDASTKKPSIASVPRDSTVFLLSPVPQNGFLHVRTAAKQEGWISAKFLAVSNVSKRNAPVSRALVRRPVITEQEPLPQHPGVAMAAARACASDLASCGNDGCSPAGSTHALANNLKRRVPSGSTTTPVMLTFDDFQSLQQQADSLVGENKELTLDDRAKLTGLSVAAGTVSEGDVVSVLGYLVPTPHPNSGESVNCNLRGADNNDFHIPISNDPQNSDYQGIVIEMIPQDRPAEWNLANLTTIQNNQQLVLVTGALFYDNFHVVNSDPSNPISGQPARFALWEVHPIITMVVCSKADNSCDSSKPSDWVALGSQ